MFSVAPHPIHHPHSTPIAIQTPVAPSHSSKLNEILRSSFVDDLLVGVLPLLRSHQDFEDVWLHLLRLTDSSNLTWSHRPLFVQVVNLSLDYILAARTPLCTSPMLISSLPMNIFSLGSETALAKMVISSVNRFLSETQLSLLLHAVLPFLLCEDDQIVMDTISFVGSQFFPLSKKERVALSSLTVLVEHEDESQEVHFLLVYLHACLFHPSLATNTADNLLDYVDISQLGLLLKECASQWQFLSAQGSGKLTDSQRITLETIISAGLHAVQSTIRADQPSRLGSAIFQVFPQKHRTAEPFYDFLLLITSFHNERITDSVLETVHSISSSSSAITLQTLIRSSFITRFAEESGFTSRGQSTLERARLILHILTNLVSHIRSFYLRPTHYYGTDSNNYLYGCAMVRKVVGEDGKLLCTLLSHRLTLEQVTGDNMDYVVDHVMEVSLSDVSFYKCANATKLFPAMMISLPNITTNEDMSRACMILSQTMFDYDEDEDRLTHIHKEWVELWEEEGVNELYVDSSTANGIDTLYDRIQEKIAQHGQYEMITASCLSDITLTTSFEFTSLHVSIQHHEPSDSHQTPSPPRNSVYPSAILYSAIPATIKYRDYALPSTTLFVSEHGSFICQETADWEESTLHLWELRINVMQERQDPVFSCQGGQVSIGQSSLVVFTPQTSVFSIFGTILSFNNVIATDFVSFHVVDLEALRHDTPKRPATIFLHDSLLKNLEIGQSFATLPDGSLNFYNTNFTECSATILFKGDQQANVLISRCYFTDCVCRTREGALLSFDISDANSVTISNTYFTNTINKDQYATVRDIMISFFNLEEANLLLKNLATTHSNISSILLVVTSLSQLSPQTQLQFDYYSPSLAPYFAISHDGKLSPITSTITSNRTEFIVSSSSAHSTSSPFCGSSDDPCASLNSCLSMENTTQVEIDEQANLSENSVLNNMILKSLRNRANLILDAGSLIGVAHMMSKGNVQIHDLSIFVPKLITYSVISLQTGTLLLQNCEFIQTKTSRSRNSEDSGPSTCVHQHIRHFPSHSVGFSTNFSSTPTRTFSPQTSHNLADQITPTLINVISGSLSVDTLLVRDFRFGACAIMLQNDYQINLGSVCFETCSVRNGILQRQSSNWSSNLTLTKWELVSTTALVESEPIVQIMSTNFTLSKFNCIDYSSTPSVPTPVSQLCSHNSGGVLIQSSRGTITHSSFIAMAFGALHIIKSEVILDNVCFARNGVGPTGFESFRWNIFLSQLSTLSLGDIQTEPESDELWISSDTVQTILIRDPVSGEQQYVDAHSFMPTIQSVTYAENLITLTGTNFFPCNLVIRLRSHMGVQDFFNSERVEVVNETLVHGWFSRDYLKKSNSEWYVGVQVTEYGIKRDSDYIMLKSAPPNPTIPASLIATIISTSVLGVCVIVMYVVYGCLRTVGKDRYTACLRRALEKKYAPRGSSASRTPTGSSRSGTRRSKYR
ncbi:hypothetical protein BLNAU_13342 [Blattamonas nauphoetae]|uniref:Uncharacterized protein n=1 Tax=Blattamonas nauphoetae TaxID=2049346 RepID=A0ABQ9XNL8_9EUKA|nr:hypothetical protein BLNAU_13342 [Blattamonas nauphoetae]